MESGRDVTGEPGCLFSRVSPGEVGRVPRPAPAPPSGACAAFVVPRIPEIFMLAHPEWIPAVPWALANWVRGSFKLTGNCKTKNRQFQKTNVLIALLKCLGIGRVCGAGAQVH